MNDNNNTPKGWGKSNSGGAKASPWENKSKTSAWGNSPSDSAWKNTSANSGNRSSKSNGVDSADVSAAVNRFANIAKKAGEKAAGAAKNAVDYAKSDEAAEKLNSLKDKAGSAVSGVGSKLSGIKNKASDKISEHRNNEADSNDNSSEQNIENTYECEASINELSESEEDLESATVAPVDNYAAYPDTAENAQDVNAPENTSPSFPNKNNNTASAYNTRNYNAQDSQRPAATPLWETSSPRYIIQKQKTSPVLIIVIIALVLVVGVLVGMFFMKNRKDNNEPVESNSSVSEIIETTKTSEISEESVTSEESEESEVKKTTAKSEDEKDKDKEEPTKPVKKVSSEEVDTALAEFLNGYTLEKDCRNPEYNLLDVNSDEVPELFVKYENIVGSAAKMYVYKNSSFISTNADLCELRICQSENIIQSIRSEGGSKYSFYHLNDLGQLDLFDELTSYAGQYYQFEDSISEKEFNDHLSDYNNHYTWCVPDFTAFKAANQSDENNSNIPSEYSGMDNIANAPSDMQFYSSDNIATGYVVTESTSLNMRAGAGSDYKVVTEIPKGAEVEIFGANSEWYYVKYIKEKKPHPDVYLGFVSRQYISSTPMVETVEVYSCNTLGQINAPDGGPINGYATSYIVDRGAVSYTRTDLMDNWHITAVNYCVVNGITWYEIYDTDDGDYYGWLDEDHIDFY